jgi:hypothetical protein
LIDAQWLRKTKRKAMLAALEKIREGDPRTRTLTNIVSLHWI